MRKLHTSAYNEDAISHRALVSSKDGPLKIAYVHKRSNSKIKCSSLANLQRINALPMRVSA